MQRMSLITSNPKLINFQKRQKYKRFQTCLFFLCLKIKHCKLGITGLTRKQRRMWAMFEFRQTTVKRLTLNELRDIPPSTSNGLNSLVIQGARSNYILSPSFVHLNKSKQSFVNEIVCPA